MFQMTRLKDPQGLAANIDELSEKISIVMTRLMRAPVNGGNPFIWALSAPKDHYITRTFFSQGRSIPVHTACTNGKAFFWNPEWLNSLNIHQATSVMEHECLHNVFFHCSPERNSIPRNHQVWNIALDYVVNAHIEKTREVVLAAGGDKKKIGELWGPPLGEIITLAELISWIDGNDLSKINGNLVYTDISLINRSPESVYAELMDHINKSPRKCKKCGSLSNKPKPKPGEDPKDEEEEGEGGEEGEEDGGEEGGGGDGEGEGEGEGEGKGKGKGKGKGGDGEGEGDGEGDDEGDGGGEGEGEGEGGCEGKGKGKGGGKGKGKVEGEGSSCGCGSDHGNTCDECGAALESLDSHVVSEQKKEEVISDLIRASEQARNMGQGTTPSGIESLLQELKTPTLTPSEVILNAFQKKAMGEGDNNNWTVFQRRPQFIHEKVGGEYVKTHKVYRPTKYVFTPKWVAMLDTSGSMGDSDIADGVKELQVVAGMQESEGYIVPCDAVPYWDKVTRINTTTDIQRTNVCGRGGTVFQQFFKELPSKLGTDFDVVIVITDGYCDSIPMELRPNCDVLWIITSTGCTDFVPSFGRVAKLKG